MGTDYKNCKICKSGGPWHYECVPENPEPIYAGSGMSILIAIGFNKTGMDAGELDFGIASARVASLSQEDRVKLTRLLSDIKKSCFNIWSDEAPKQ